MPRSHWEFRCCFPVRGPWTFPKSPQGIPKIPRGHLEKEYLSRWEFWSTRGMFMASRQLSFSAVPNLSPIPTGNALGIFGSSLVGPAQTGFWDGGQGVFGIPAAFQGLGGARNAPTGIKPVNSFPVQGCGSNPILCPIRVPRAPIPRGFILGSLPGGSHGWL